MAVASRRSLALSVAVICLFLGMFYVAFRYLPNRGTERLAADYKALDHPSKRVREEAARRIRLARNGTTSRVMIGPLELSLKGGALGFMFAPTRRTLVLAGREDDVIFWRIPSDPLRRFIHPDEIVRVQTHEGYRHAIALQGTNLVTVSTVSLDRETPGSRAVELRIYPLSDPLSGGFRESSTVVALDTGDLEVATFSPDGRILATSGRRVENGKPASVLKLWDASNGKDLFSFDRPDIFSHTLTFSADGKRLGTLAESTIRTREAKIRTVDLTIWDTTTGAAVATFTELAPKTWCLALSPNGNRLATGRGDEEGKVGIVELWDVSTQAMLASYRWPYNGISSLAFSPDGNLLAIGNSGYLVKLCRMGEGKHFELVDVLVSPTGVDHIAFSPVENLIAVGTDNWRAIIWELHAQH